jgi:hypothetical protein
MKPSELNTPMVDPFETIESAHNFVTLLSETVVEAKRELEVDVQRESSSTRSRRLEALRMALYSLEKLELHMNRSSRILNDLRSLRRLLFQERGIPETHSPGVSNAPVVTVLPAPLRDSGTAKTAVRSPFAA